MDQARTFTPRTSDGWLGVEPREYKREGDFNGVMRHTIVTGETMQLRHFDVAPGGYSSLERHEHEHYVIISHGCGTVIVGTEAYKAQEGDVIYVPANTAHQFINEASASGPLGFYCVVSAERDRPRLLDEQELRALDGTPAGAVARHRLLV